MINFPNGTCTKRPGMLEQQIDGGKWEVCAFDGILLEASGERSPFVFPCEHGALEAARSITESVRMLHANDMSRFPRVDYRYVFVDEVPKVLDKPVTDTTEANNIINRIKGKV